MMTRVALLAVLTFGTPALAACPAPDRQAVTATLQAMFDAAMADDAGKLGAIFAPGFYAFDAGKRYDAASLEATILKLHQSGKRYVWQVTLPDVHISCDTAWIAYVNKGSLTQSGKVTPLTWLESADLTYAGNAWHVAFLESARASDNK